MHITLAAADWWQLFGHFFSLSLLAVGGAITAAPDMHRYLVTQNSWLSEAQFNASIALAQAAPGPNVLFVALMGWHVGLNTGMGVWAAMLGVACTMAGILLPSTTLTWAATRWAHRNQTHMGVRAFKAGMAPIVIGLLLATGWLLVSVHGNWRSDWAIWALALTSVLLVWKTQMHMLWLLGAGAALGALGLV